MASTKATLSLLRKRLERLILIQLSSSPTQRILVALAGVPGSGKSTISKGLLSELHNHGIADVTVLPMDGFHYSRATLASFDDPAMALRKRGAPFTFDVEELLKLLCTLKNLPVTKSNEPEILIHAPAFDHAEQDPVPDAICISSRSRIVIVEGNYTLLKQEPWNQIARLVDERWFVEVPSNVAQDRIVKRHLEAGIEATSLAALARAQDNDIPNGNLIQSQLIEPDIRILN